MKDLTYFKVLSSLKPGKLNGLEPSWTRLAFKFVGISLGKIKGKTRYI